MRGRVRREPRLDPVRWRRPGRSTLLRSAVVAALLVTAAVVMWTGPQSCAPSCPAGHGPAATAAPSRNDPADLPPAAERLPPTGERLPPPAAEHPPPAAERVPERVPERPAVPPGSIGVPIRLAEPTALGLVRPGDHVDVFRVAGTGGSPQAVATAALVLGVIGADDPGTGGLLLALTPAEARRTVTAPGSGYAVLIRPEGPPGG